MPGRRGLPAWAGLSAIGFAARTAGGLATAAVQWPSPAGGPGPVRVPGPSRGPAQVTEVLSFSGSLRRRAGGCQCPDCDTDHHRRGGTPRPGRLSLYRAVTVCGRRLRQSSLSRLRHCHVTRPCHASPGSPATPSNSLRARLLRDGSVRGPVGLNVRPAGRTPGPRRRPARAGLGSSGEAWNRLSDSSWQSRV